MSVGFEFEGRVDGEVEVEEGEEVRSWISALCRRWIMRESSRLFY